MSSKSFGECYTLNASYHYLDVEQQNQAADILFSIDKSLYYKVSDNGQQEIDLDVVTTNQLQDINRQLIVADFLYKDVLRLGSPLKQLRYQNAKNINVNFTAGDKAYGKAYDEVVRDKKNKNSICFIMITLSNKVYADRSDTPAHELFHLYQSSVMMFKQSWLTEGLARWSESLLTEGTGKEEALPGSREEFLDIMGSSYDASKFWTRLFKLIDQNNEFSVPNYLNTVTYLNNEPILKDNKAYGVTFIKVLFDELSKESDHVSEIKGWDRYAWKEKDQKDPALNPYIWNAVKRAVAKFIPYEQQSEELRRCMEIEL